MSLYLPRYIYLYIFLYLPRYIYIYIYLLKYSDTFDTRKSKDKFHATTGYEGQEAEQQYSTRFSNLAPRQRRVSGQRHVPVDLPPEREPVFIVQEARQSLCQSGRVRILSPLKGFDIYARTSLIQGFLIFQSLQLGMGRQNIETTSLRG